LVEFVSANPTGPLTAAGGRHAAFGDALCRVLEFVGHDVQREYYVNDHGTQIELFGASIAARMRGEDPPEGGYGGEYVAELAQQFEAEGLSADDHAALIERGVGAMLEQIEATLSRYRVAMDSFFKESALHADDRVSSGLERMAETGHVYESEGATWLRTTAYGDDKDRVLRRSSGEFTYFAADIAYHGQTRTRFRSSDQRLGRRSSRIRGSHEGDVRCDWRARQDRADHHAARAHCRAWRAGQDVEAQGRVRDAR
jgi:arginyl-tRNA synthetase